MGMFPTVFKPKNPADAAMPYLQQIPGTITPYYQPYIDAGQQALPTLTNQYNQLISNPQQMLSSMGSGFQQSPGYQWQVDQSMNSANQAAAAGGMAGSPAEQQQVATTTNQLANQDYYNYLNHVLGLYGQGMSGMQGINQMGYQASTGLANALGMNLESEGNLAYAGQQNKNMMTAALAKALGGGIGSFMGSSGGSSMMNGMNSMLGGIGGLFGSGGSSDDELMNMAMFGAEALF